MIVAGLAAWASAAWACICMTDIDYAPADGATLPPRPVIVIAGYTSFEDDPPRITLHDAHGRVIPITLDRASEDTWELRPERRLRAGSSVQVVVWSGDPYKAARTYGARFRVGRSPAARLEPPRVVSSIRRDFGWNTPCGPASVLDLTFADAPIGGALVIWTAQPGKPLHYTAPPTDLIPVSNQTMRMGNPTCRLGGFTLVDQYRPESGAVRLGLAWQDARGRRSAPTEVEVPPRQ